MSRPLVYTTEVRDAPSRLPVVVVDSTALPDDGQSPDPATDVPDLVAQLPKTDFVIVYFASRAPKSPHMGWMRRVHASSSQSSKKRIKKVYIVHTKWYSRASNRALAPIVSPKFASKIHHIKSLAELAREMDITAIDINPPVYSDDIERNESDITGSIPVPKHSRSIFGRRLEHRPVSYWRAAFTFLNQSRLSEMHFAPLSRVDSESAALAAVSMHAVSREQKSRSYDFGPFAVMAVVKEYSLSLPEPLIRYSDCPLPVRDTPEYFDDLVSYVPSAHLNHSHDLVKFGQNVDLDPRVVASSLGPATMGFINPSKEKAAISSRVFRILMNFWSDTQAPLTPVSPALSPAAPPLPIRRSNPSSNANSGSCSESSTSTSMSSPAESRRPSTSHYNPLQPSSYARSQPTASPSLLEAIEFPTKGPLPRELPSEIIDIQKKRAPAAPNRRAYGKVAELMRLYNDDR